MDNYREVSLLPSKTVGASGTETIDLAIDEPLTALYVKFGATNGAAVADAVPPENCISKIEIVDGGQVYYSASGPEAVAAAVYDTGQWPAAWYDERANGGQNISIPLLFGRYIGDEDFAFSPARLLNPQLKVTWARNALHTTTGYTLGVRVKAMQGVGAPSRALMVRNIRTFTSASSGIEGTSLPVDLAIRRLFVRAYKAETLWAEILTHLKLDCDVGKLIVFDVSQYTFKEILQDVFPSVEIASTVCLDDGVWKDGWLGSIAGGAVNPITPDVFAGVWSAGAGKYWQWSATDGGVSSNDQVSQLRLWGHMPHTVLAYQFGRKDDPASWFVADRYGQVRLELTQGTASVSLGILLQRPTPIP